MRNRIFYFLFSMVFAFSQAKPALAFHPLESKKLDVKIDASAGETFDDNVTFVKSGKKSDLITELAAGLHATYEGRKHLLDLKAGTVQQIFTRETGFSNNAQNAALDYRYLLTERDTIRLKDTFRHYEEPRSFEDQFGQSNGRYSRLINRADLEYTRQLDSQWAVTTRYGNEVILLSRNDLRDSTRNRGGFDLKYAWSSATIYSFIYEFVHHAFESAGNNPSASANINSAAVGVKHYLTKKLFVEGQGGFDLIDNFQNELDAKPFFSGSFNLDLDEKTQLQFLKYEFRSTTSTFQSSVFTTHQISAAARRQISRRLFWKASGFYGHGKFEQTGIKDNLFGAETGFDYELTRDLKVNASYSFALQDSNSSFREYAKNMAAAKLAYVFG